MTAISKKMCCDFNYFFSLSMTKKNWRSNLKLAVIGKLKDWDILKNAFSYNETHFVKQVTNIVKHCEYKMF